MQHYNPSIGEDLHRIFNLKGQSPSSEVSNEIVPVILIQRSINIVKRNGALNTSGITVYTTPSDKDFYLTNAILSLTKDVTATATNSEIRVIIDGVTTAAIRLSSLSLTADSKTGVVNFDPPMKIDRGTIISIVSDTTVANIRQDATIAGYTVETLKGV